jgi:hypothetical protein
MMKFLSCIITGFLLLSSSAYANYTTPGTGGKYSLDDLVTNSGGDVIYSDAYYVNDTIIISTTDTLLINSDAVVKFAGGTFFDVNGTIIVNPPTGVLFTAQNNATGYLGMRLNASIASSLKKLTFQYAVSLRLSDCSIPIDSCTFQFNNNNASTTFGNGAIALFRASPMITNCKFLNNQRAAIQGGANISNAPRIINCLFMDNNTTNQNVPQINLGATGTDTAKILNNQILRASNRSGGIGFLPVGDLHAVISGNVIKNNRYGITLNGGSNINALISYNVIDSNNTEGNPISGGSGISFSGGTATSHQNSIVTGNYIRWNLWGVTISPTSSGGGAMPNLGNLGNADTTDDGKNFIYGNTNSTTPDIDFYNNNVDDIMAQGNYWGSNDPAFIEARIFHDPDNSALGLVNYSSYITLPIELILFNANWASNSVTLSWRTASENNSEYFKIEKSLDGRSFSAIGREAAAGHSSTAKDYRFVDRNMVQAKQYYRLQMMDKDGRFKYSTVVVVNPAEIKASAKLYPTVLTGSQPLTAEILSPKPQTIIISLFSIDGKLLQKISRPILAGSNSFSIYPADGVTKGLLQVRVMGENLEKVFSILKN